jgi:isohexenylglutaconyl-CoA hydratase
MSLALAGSRSAGGRAMSAAATVAQRRDGPVLHLTLNRPEARNALSLAMVAELREALAAAEADDDVRVIVLRGAGGHFCAGGDLKDMAAARLRLADEGPGVLRQMNAAFGQLCVAFAATPLATVAVLEGAVMGGGFGLACVADVVLAAPSVSFRLPETSLGVVPAQIAPFLVDRLGASQARRLAVTGGRVDGEQALRLGLVHEVHDADQLDVALQRVVGEILRCAPRALAATKRLMARAQHREAESLIDEAAAVFADAAVGDEGHEGVAAFVEKRAPRWVVS